MNILVANDDGIQAMGIKRLVETLSEVADVYVFSPTVERSASSHGITTKREVKLKKVDFPKAVRAYAVDGTPSDCVKMGLRILEKEGIAIDMVYTGINHGGNLSTDTLYSGTVSAACEGAMEKIPSVAVSVDSHNAEHFDYACKLSLEIMEFAKKNERIGSVISINTPNLPADQIKGVKIVKMSEIVYSKECSLRYYDDGDISYGYSSEFVFNNQWDEDVDVRVIREGYGTITMVQYDLNDYEGIKKLKEWEMKYGN